MFETCWIHHCYLEKKAVTRAAPTPTAANASHELPPFLASAVNSTPILSELNLSGTLACRRDGKIDKNVMNKSITRFSEDQYYIQHNVCVCGSA